MRLKSIGVVAALVAVVALPAWATILEPTDAWQDANHGTGKIGEENLYSIVNTIYGTSFTDNSDMTFASLATQVFAAGDYSVVAEAKYAGNDPQHMGYYLPSGSKLSPKVQLIYVNTPSANDGYNLSGDLTGSFSASALFGFYMSTDTRGAGGPDPISTWYSEESLNEPSDQLVLYDLELLTGDSALHNRYLMGWEDQPYSASDRDYQDLVVELTTVVPEPTSFLLVGLGLAGIVARKARKALGY